MYLDSTKKKKKKPQGGIFSPRAVFQQEKKIVRLLASRELRLFEASNFWGIFRLPNFPCECKCFTLGKYSSTEEKSKIRANRRPISITSIAILISIPVLVFLPIPFLFPNFSTCCRINTS